MSEDFDNDLKRLFAEAAERPDDETFVLGVRRDMAGARWRPLMLAAAVYGLAALAAGGALAVLMPWLGEVLATGAAAVAPMGAAFRAVTPAVVVLALILSGGAVLSALRGSVGRRL